MGASNKTGQGKVWYSLGAEEGRKDGKPLFKQVIQRKPTPPPTNLEESNGRYMLTFTDIEGTITGIVAQEKDDPFSKKPQKVVILILAMMDEEGPFNVDLGNIKGAYAINFMGRLLNEKLDISKPIFMFPYKMEGDKKDTLIMGIAINQRGQKIEGMSKEKQQELGCPSARTPDGEYDFTNVARWLFKGVRAKLEQAFFEGAPEVEQVEEVHYAEEPEDKMEASKSLYEIGAKDTPPPPKDMFEDDDLPF
jgi:hypothetical protein